MKKNILIVSFLTLGVFISCSVDVGEENKEKATATESTVENVEEIDVLYLNNGKKWLTNEETHEGMTQIKVILENMDPLTLEDFHLMGAKCDEQTSFIINNCSMKGDEHNQLHFVLHPILNDIAGLINAETIEKAEVLRASLEMNIMDYFSHFEV